MTLAHSMLRRGSVHAPRDTTAPLPLGNHCHARLARTLKKKSYLLKSSVNHAQLDTIAHQRV
jgi:hypothetical protein